MVRRIKDDGQWECRHNEGLKSITWAYGTAPGGDLWTSNSLEATMNGSKSDSADAREARREMLYLSADVPNAKYSKQSVAGGISATYVCKDGAEFDSKSFLFVP